MMSLLFFIARIHNIHNSSASPGRQALRVSAALTSTRSASRCGARRWRRRRGPGASARGSPRLCTHCPASTSRILSSEPGWALPKHLLQSSTASECTKCIYLKLYLAHTLGEMVICTTAHEAPNHFINNPPSSP